MDVVAYKPLARWRLIAAITYKELITILHHPYHIVSLVMPLFVSVVFLFLIPTLSSTDIIEVVLVDEGSSSLPAALDGLPDVSVTIADDETAVFKALNKEATAGFIIPDGFDTAVAARNAPELTIYLNSEARSSLVAKFQRIFVEETTLLRDAELPAQITWQERQPGGIATQPFSLQAFLFITLMLLTIGISTCSIIPLLVMEERDQGTLQTLIASPANLVDSLIGKALAVFSLIIVLVLIISLVNDGFVGNWPLTAVAIIITTLFMIGLGLILGLSMHKNHGKAAASVAVMIAAMPSWFATTPIDSLAPVPAFILRAIPTQYFVATLNQSLNNQPWSAAIGSLAIIFVWTAVIYLLLGWRVKKFSVQ
ncbi:MAG: ABC transporter permease [Chloroflexi bacterium]|nr:ABC transporter permease [Chloroflexota bacterium]